MTKKIIAVSHDMKGMLDDDYTLFEDGSVLQEYDNHFYPDGQNLRSKMTVDQLLDKIKMRIYEASSDEYKENKRKNLKLN